MSVQTRRFKPVTIVRQTEQSNTFHEQFVTLFFRALRPHLVIRQEICECLIRFADFPGEKQRMSGIRYPLQPISG
jgi:hypothetical protein